MKFLAKIINFIKNFHPIRDFAKPVSRKHQHSVNVTTTFEALARELSQHEQIVTNEPTHVTHELETPTRFRRLAAHYEVEENSSYEHTDEPVVVMPPIEVMASKKVVEVFVPEVVSTSVLNEQGERVRDFVFAEVAPQEIEAEAPKKTRKRTAVAKASAPKSKTKVVAKKPVAKKVVKAKKPVTKIRKKKEETPVPPEAMGFGF
jgi:hypothetical protein